LYAGAHLLEILSNHHPEQTAAQLFETIPNSVNTPELSIPVPEAEKLNCVARLIQAAQFEEGCVSTVDGLRVDFQDGFGLVRPSNTGPNLVMRFEGKTETALHRIQSQFRDLFQTLAFDWKLPF
jgi:phosphomannomutase